MVVSVVQVRIVRVRVADWFMAVPMRMRFSHRTFMGMLMMVVVHMSMLMLEDVMGVFMLVTFGKVQPEADSHQNAGGR